MKAIITPLNEYFYNYQKYDGLDFFDRLGKKEPSSFTRFKESIRYWSNSSKKVYNVIIYSIAVIPIGTIVLLVLFIISAFSLLLKLQFKNFLSNFKEKVVKKIEPLLVLQVRDNDAFAGVFSPANRIKEIYKNGRVFGLLVKKHQQRQKRKRSK